MHNRLESETRPVDSQYATGYNVKFPSIFLDGCEPFAEDLWKQIKINEMNFQGVMLCPRCKVPTINQEDAKQGSEPTETMMKFRSAKALEVNTSTTQYKGRVYLGQMLVWENTDNGSDKVINVGDAVHVEKLVSYAVLEEPPLYVPLHPYEERLVSAIMKSSGPGMGSNVTPRRRYLLELIVIVLCLSKCKWHGPLQTPEEDSRDDEDENCHFFGFFDDELPSDYYKKLFFNLHEENKMLKNNMGKNMYKNKKKSNNGDEGCMEMGEMKDDLTLIKSKLQMYDKVVVVLVILVAFVVASRLFA
ncbi:amidoxime reducing component [Tanacetum coccineum]|uniref:Amidoxime reducing component n=1 Tax=Tanacetum coccineum TaxID=301880 RepID=A0ABQ4XZF3_9ASTR